MIAFAAIAAAAWVAYGLVVLAVAERTIREEGARHSASALNQLIVIFGWPVLWVQEMRKGKR